MESPVKVPEFNPAGMQFNSGLIQTIKISGYLSDADLGYKNRDSSLWYDSLFLVYKEIEARLTERESDKLTLMFNTCKKDIQNASKLPSKYRTGYNSNIEFQLITLDLQIRRHLTHLGIINVQKKDARNAITR